MVEEDFANAMDISTKAEDARSGSKCLPYFGHMKMQMAGYVTGQYWKILELQDDIQQRRLSTSPFSSAISA